MTPDFAKSSSTTSGTTSRVRLGLSWSSSSPSSRCGQAHFLFHKSLTSTLQRRSELGPSACSDLKVVPVETLGISATPFKGSKYSEKSLLDDEIYGYVYEQWKAMVERLETVTGDDGEERSVDPESGGGARSACE